MQFLGDIAAILYLFVATNWINIDAIHDALPLTMAESFPMENGEDFQYAFVQSYKSGLNWETRN